MKFSRPKGFAGSTPRNWIDRNLPLCPFCGKRSEWEMGMKMGFLSWNRYHFRCSNINCMVVFSIPVPDVTRSINIVTLTRTQNKSLKLEDYGNNDLAKNYVGKEIHIDTLKQWALNKSGKEEQFCAKCGTQLASDELYCPKCGGKRDG